jgi:23S rRNA pseudouridine2605 synthase
MKKNRLAKFLAAAGVASRRKCEELIFEGLVRVNGKITLLPQTMVNENDMIECEGHKVKFKEQKVYFILNKPEGYLCSPRSDGRGKLVLDLFSGVNLRLFTVGRLDRDTTGLLLVTNDGTFANRVIHPSSNIQKEYVVKTGNEITDEHLKTIAKGIRIEGVLVKPVKVSKVRKGTVKIVVSDGKKREVRYLVQAAGLEVRELKRTRIGGLRLGDIPPGHWREMTEGEKEIIFK